MTPVLCPSCRAELSPGAHYCHRCGRAVGKGSDRTVWTIAFSAVALMLALIIYYVNNKASAAATPDMANAGNAGPAGASGATANGAPPDISQMSPKERFLRLSDRVLS